MKRISAALLALLLLVTAPACTRQPAPADSAPTGYENQIEQPQIFYNGSLYRYNAGGFDKKIPQGFVPAGQVRTVDHFHIPTENFSGCQVEVGQNIYANPDDPGRIYVEYESGCAVFLLSSEKAV